MAFKCGNPKCGRVVKLRQIRPGSIQIRVVGLNSDGVVEISAVCPHECGERVVIRNGVDPSAALVNDRQAAMVLGRWNPPSDLDLSDWNDVPTEVTHGVLW
jgi:hypothetical protein